MALDSYANFIIIIAEDGATIDFRGSNSWGDNPFIFYSPNTEILGNIPETSSGTPLARQVTPVSISTDVGPFNEAFALDITVEGSGSVTRSLPGPYYEFGTEVQLTAQAQAGHFFTGWSGSITSTNPTITASRYYSDITANFSSGRTLTTYSGLGGQINVEPNKEIYADGETVTLTAQPAAGFEFLGWGGDVFSLDDSLDLSMNHNAQVVGIFRSLTQNSLTQITNANHKIIPEGETITLTGSGFSGASKASFFENWGGDPTEASLREISDTTLEVDAPADLSSWGANLLIETQNGSTLTIGADESEIDYFDGVGTYPDLIPRLMVESGAILEGFSNENWDPFLTDLIYVKAGGVLKVGSYVSDILVFAEDGAVLDFRGLGQSHARYHNVYYSPQTEILGEIPTNNSGLPIARQLTPISLSLGVGPFTEGFELNLRIEGNGTVTRNLPGPYYELGTAINLTAQSEEGAFFIEWSGAVTSTNPTVTVYSNFSKIVATFSSGRSLTTYSSSGGQINRSPDKNFYDDGEIVTLTPQAAAGFEFQGWGGDIFSLDDSLDLTMNQNTQVVGIFKSLEPDNRPIVASADYEAVPEGDTITLTGSGFSGASKASFIWSGQITEAPVRTISDSTLEVDYTAWQPSREHMLLIEAQSGSTLTIGADESEIDYFDGVGTYPDLTPLLMVESGAILEGFSNENWDPFLTDLIYVKAGGVLKVGSYVSDILVFAEDGAVLDFQGLGPSHSYYRNVYYSPQTEVIGELPTNNSGLPIARQLTPISLSLGVGPFTEGFRVSVTTEGPGTVTGFDETITYYKRGDSLDLVATPSEGNFFIRWVGSNTSNQENLNLSVYRNIELTARFSPLADFLSGWRIDNFTPEQLADPTIAGLNADPDNDGHSNATEYVFGGNPLEADNGAKVTVLGVKPSENLLRFSYVRPRYAADVEYSYSGSRDFLVWSPVAESGTVDEISTEVISDTLEKVSLDIIFTEDLPSAYSIRVIANIQ